MDNLNMFTKEELVSYIRLRDRSSFFHRDALHDLLEIRYERLMDEYNESFQADTDFLQSIDLKTRDQLATQYNAETDPQKKNKQLAKIIPYDRKLAEYWERKKTDKLWEKTQKTFDLMMNPPTNDTKEKSHETI